MHHHHLLTLDLDTALTERGFHPEDFITTRNPNANQHHEQNDDRRKSEKPNKARDRDAEAIAIAID
jgi:hypothetical protein